MSELRYHPFLRQWVITATHRQDRTFLPPADFCPLCPTRDPAFPTEIPFDDYDIVVFENRFPSLVAQPPEAMIEGTALCPVRPSSGVCEVVCYSSDHSASLATLPLRQVQKLVRVWKDRYVDLGRRPEVQYVFIFENKGQEIGVTLDHPHGQIYGYPFLPPVVAEEIRSEHEYWLENGSPLMGAVIREEVAFGKRMVYENDTCLAFIPSFARYPFETYVTPKRPTPSFAEMDGTELDGFAEALQAVAQRLDRLFGFSMPYVMAIHQRPTMPGYDGSWLHAEFYPPYRSATKLKYLAGSEAGAGVFINDTLAEDSAALLRGTN